MPCSQPALKRYFHFGLTVGTPQDIADDLEALFKLAAFKDFRPAFFDWQLDIPCRSQQLLSSRRKLKMQAHAARIKFLSMCIETAEYRRRQIVLWSGQRKNLRELLRRDPDAYTGKMKSALQPFHLDEGGFTNLTSLLVNLGALDPNNPKKEHRLSDRALARILHDIISCRKSQSWWFG
ncbi:hypothetical protein F442_19609, partial [Phytophthora nicotianae P10297]